MYFYSTISVRNGLEWKVKLRICGNIFFSFCNLNFLAMYLHIWRIPCDLLPFILVSVWFHIFRIFLLIHCESSASDDELLSSVAVWDRSLIHIFKWTVLEKSFAANLCNKQNLHEFTHLDLFETLNKALVLDYVIYRARLAAIIFISMNIVIYIFNYFPPSPSWA